MKHPIPSIPRDVAELIENYTFIAHKQGSSESSIMFWILEDIQESEVYTPAMHWIENNFSDVAIAVQYGRYTIDEYK